MFPILVLLYINTSYSSASITIDFVNIVLALLVVLVPIAIGVYFRYVNTETKCAGGYLWEWLEKLTSALGGIFVLVPLVIGIIQNQYLFSESWKMWVASVLYQPVGSLLGYVAAILCGLSKKDSRTVALQTGIQNGTLVLAILYLSDSQSRSLVFPLFYSFWYIIHSVLITILFRYISSTEPHDDANVSPVALSSPKVLPNDSENPKDLTSN